MLLRILTFLAVCQVTTSHKILMFSPTASKSHMISQGRIADELANAGHEVVNFEPDFLNLTDKFVPCKKCRRWPVTGLNNYKFKKIQNGLSGDVFQQSSIWSKIFNTDSDPYQDEYTNMCEEMVTNKELIEKLKKEKFDAYFGEQIHLCGMGLAHLIGIKHRFWIASCTMSVSMRDSLGIPTPSSLIPFMSTLDATPAPFWQRAKNFVLQMAHIRDEYRDVVLTNDMFKKNFGSDFPCVEFLAKTSDLIFVSTDELLEIQAPTLSNVVHIGGLGLSSEGGGLDEKFVKIMEKGKGVILFSLGTIANTTNLPPTIMENLMKITQKFKDYEFIIKVDKFDRRSFDLAEGLSNVLVVDWVPQTAVLAHPRLKAFITHAGYNSLMESAYAGVPVILIPFMFDQPRNGRSVERKGWGILRDRFQLIKDPDAIEGAIKEILVNPTYQEKANRLKKLMRSKPQSASERLVKMTNWVLENDGVEELQYEGKHMDFFTFYNLDIIITAASIPVLIFIVLRISNISIITSSPKNKKD
ncbi:Putative UDP-glucuronosyltransferase ugt-48 [Caenorhabditis elegans]|uniref:Putative UDP-glucuronosyltransferase ugt-48 n=1 Tax=Caenorhabditis elegans TaxID=6239 RepID=UGT48_CAEEL|nr:Putative UDP-glucuronosyltransferase ugt-48 [Caenorhabditis elegans]Q18081.3 RecName: Full=Putative UDP-glucuronosyltransferase ugt-48; Short=UDPGT 48; Flags: Precursor [Caenorhabditis elegans]CCD65106.1 Putative UDP-glucuronosyltransferase ugt-48 [Caenorhabditis elegans]|eukprot:NP_504464.2 Putative UDP-glucuronosyltransferase ugt-48 [Caenorhabditis elegans]